MKNKGCTLWCFTHERPSKDIHQTTGKLELTSNDNGTVFHIKVDVILKISHSEILKFLK